VNLYGLGFVTAIPYMTIFLDLYFISVSMGRIISFRDESQE